ncbi:alpha/beta hydrolase [Azotobacter beijerinckii]|uniref:Lysophospholipase, alpha-beta hydrolase superfamily n=1 Tax=Azotobacter beijerinckii TaxID=170623 RepID=A0A1I4B4J8_9GAMM|nr:alpha/beta hydrolase [Azotobacter beijerinckii]SFA89984.1 Lysophospholipase, alpha-beta hydrolase superfamily [Azotobacter beijerinckii]SFK63634.1 Lysophospholipase, alpha-beta hydrolase superfamily [Azotobacter beijerinckii]
MSESFHPDLLRPLLQPLAAGGDELPQIQAYRRYYGLDLGERRPGVQGRLGCFSVGTYRIVAQVWWPERPRATLLLLHGYYDHMGLYRHVLDWALGMGFAVLSCDLPGHGLSSGAPASIDDFAEYQAVFRGLLAEAAVLDLPRPWHLFGQSTGGAILLDYLLSGAPRPEVGETILSAPLVRPRSWGLSKLGYRALRPFVESIPRRFSDNSGDAAFLAFIQRDPLQARILPTAWVGALARWIPRIEAAPRSERSPLIIQGDADLTVDWRHNLDVLRDKFRDPQLLMLPSARHHLANEREAVRQRYFDFLRERLE